MRVFNGARERVLGAGHTNISKFGQHRGRGAYAYVAYEQGGCWLLFAAPQKIETPPEHPSNHNDFQVVRMCWLVFVAFQKFATPLKNLSRRVGGGRLCLRCLWNAYEMSIHRQPPFQHLSVSSGFECFVNCKRFFELHRFFFMQNIVEKSILNF